MQFAPTFMHEPFPALMLILTVNVGWRICSFQDTDVNDNEFTNFEVAYWRNGGIEWASLNDSLHYFRTWSDAIDFYEDAIEGVCI